MLEKNFFSINHQRLRKYFFNIKLFIIKNNRTACYSLSSYKAPLNPMDDSSMDVDVDNKPSETFFKFIMIGDAGTLTYLSLVS